MWSLTIAATLALIVLCLGLGLLAALSSLSVSVNMDATHVLGSESLNGRNPKNITIVDSSAHRAQLNDIAELTRAYVIGRDVTFPLAANGIGGYDNASISHLSDVRQVIFIALWAIFGASVLNILLILYALKAKKLRGYLRGSMIAGILVLVMVVIAAVLALLDFSSLFMQFHQLLFAAGTWTFSAESLLIQAFPLDFWVRELAIWVVISVFCAVFCLILGVCTRKRVAKSGFSVN